MLYQMAQMAEKLAQHPGPVADFFCFEPNSKPTAFWVNKLAEVTHSGYVSSTPHPPKKLLGILPLL